jgi:hypothetical protein
MKLFAKMGLGALLGAGLLVASNVHASKVEAHADYAAILNAQAVARVEKDLIKLNCVNDKLVLANATLNIIDADPSGGNPTKESELHELRVAAENCAGKKQVNFTSDNSFTAPPGAQEPGEGGAPDWGVVFEPGVNASPSTPTPRRAGGFHTAHISLHSGRH